MTFFFLPLLFFSLKVQDSNYYFSFHFLFSCPLCQLLEGGGYVIECIYLFIQLFVSWYFLLPGLQKKIPRDFG